MTTDPQFHSLNTILQFLWEILMSENHKNYCKKSPNYLLSSLSQLPFELQNVLFIVFIIFIIAINNNNYYIII